MEENEDDLHDTLGPGHHFGEWYGLGIQRGYGLQEKRFALFNVRRWSLNDVAGLCEVVPVLYDGGYSHHAIYDAMHALRSCGSRVAGGRGWKAEGIVVYHTAARTMFKMTLEGDEKPKSR